MKLSVADSVKGDVSFKSVASCVVGNGSQVPEQGVAASCEFHNNSI